MKKILVLSLVIVLFLGGVVGASSINGDYKGNPIVRVKVNGNLVESEVPAQIIDGSTLLPLRAVSQALGASIQWDQYSYTANVSTNNAGNASANSDLENYRINIKLISKIAEQYRMLNILLDSASTVSDRLALAYNSIYGNYQPLEGLNIANKQLNYVIDTYNATIQQNEDLIALALKYDIDISDTRTMLNDISKSIDFFKESFAQLNVFYQTNSGNSFDNYLQNSKMGFDALTNSQRSSITRYFFYYNTLQNM